MTEPLQAVFLSYASQDAEAAQRICEALRAAGIGVFFDQNSLRGGDAWELKIRQEIHNCALFIPILSQHTQARLEGYFRHEWNLAIERSHHMAAQKAFLVPVLVDGMRGQHAVAPEAFRAVQWTSLPRGDTPPAFVARIKQLLSPEAAPPNNVSGAATGLEERVRATRRLRPLLLAIFAVAVLALAYVVFHKTIASRHPGTGAADAVSPARATPAAADFSPPPHSLAILPFVNISGDKEQEYFSDGLTEELLNSLSRINELQVAARTSSFSFQGEHPDIATVAHKLNVAAVLEGSVRRSGHTVRITAQLINGMTGFHFWSETYDRDLKDVLKLQTEIATAVAVALKVTLLGDEAAKIEVDGTHVPAANDAYLRASKAYWQEKHEAAIGGYTEAIRLDPHFALAYAGRSIALLSFTDDAAPPGVVRAELAKAQADADKAIELAHDQSEGHLALAIVYEGLLKFTPATEEFERALALGAGNARILRDYGLFAVFMGRGDFGLTLVRRAQALDPLNQNGPGHVANALFFLRRYTEARAAFEETDQLASTATPTAMIGLTYYLEGDYERARSVCEKSLEEEIRLLCLAITYDKVGRHKDAEAVLAQARAKYRDSEATQYAAVYAQWGDTAQALDWLETSSRQRSGDLLFLKQQPLLDPLRKEPRFQAVERGLKFPD